MDDYILMTILSYGSVQVRTGSSAGPVIFNKDEAWDIVVSLLENGLQIAGKEKDEQGNLIEFLRFFGAEEAALAFIKEWLGGDWEPA